MDQVNTSIIDMANGALKERVDYEMARIMHNIADPNTKATTQREITLKITFTPDENRQHIEVACGASAKLAPMNPVKTSLAAGSENGQPIALELTPQIPGQLNISGSLEPERKVLKLAEYTA